MTITRFGVTVQFAESASNDTNDTLIFQGQKCPYAYDIHPQSPNFSSISFYGESVLSYAPLLGKVHQMTANGLDMFKIKKYQSAWYKFSSISLYDEPLSSYGSNLGKVHWLTPEWPWHGQGQRYTYAYNRHSRGPNFLSVSLYNEPFSNYTPFFAKVHWMTPNDLDMFKVKNTNVHSTYTPEDQTFVSFARWAVFKEIEIF